MYFYEKKSLGFCFYLLHYHLFVFKLDYFAQNTSNIFTLFSFHLIIHCFHNYVYDQVKILENSRVYPSYVTVCFKKFHKNFEFLVRHGVDPAQR